MHHIDLRGFPALSAGQRRADHGGCEKCVLIVRIQIGHQILQAADVDDVATSRGVHGLDNPSHPYLP